MTRDYTLFVFTSLETKKSKTTSDKIDIGKSEYANLIDAASQGNLYSAFNVANSRRI